MDSPNRAASVAELENMFPAPQGPMFSRRGSVNIGQAGTTIGNVRMVEFNLESEPDSLALELGEGYLRVYNHHERQDLIQNVLIDPHFDFGFTHWQDSSTGANVTITFLPALYAVTLANDTSGHQAAVSASFASISLSILSEVEADLSLTGGGSCIVKIGTAPGLSDIASWSITTEGRFSRTWLSTLSVTHYVTFQNTGPNGTSITISQPDVHKTGGLLELVTPYLSADIPFLNFQELPSSDQLIIVGNGYRPYLLTRSTASTWTFAILTLPYDPFSLGDGPAHITIAQQRLIFASNVNYPSRIWASHSGDYFNLDPGTALDNEGIIADVSEDKIRWIKGHKNLLFGTLKTEYAISSSTGVLTPTDLQIEPQSGYGSSDKVQSISIGDQVIFVSSDRKRIRAASFDENQQGWIFPDLTWGVSHLFVNARIKEIAYLREPINLLLCILDDGTVVSCVYDRLQGINGWSRHPLNSNITGIMSMCTNINDDGGDIFLVNDLSNGVRGIDVMHVGDESTDSFTDSSVKGFITVGQQLLGLSHLNGIKVSVKIDGALYPDQTVSGGLLDLPASGLIASVGLPYRQRIKLLPLDVGHMGGSGSGVMKHINKIFVRLYNSSLPLINGVRPPDRTPATPMGEPEPLISDDIQVTNMGNDRKAQIVIEQSLPLPLEVHAIFGEVGQKGL